MKPQPEPQETTGKNSTKQLIFNKYLSYGHRDANLASIGAASPTLHIDDSDLLPERKDARILDLGCGMGHFLAYLKGN